MPRTTPRPTPTDHQTLVPTTTHCPACGQRMVLDYYARRTLTSLQAVTRYRFGVRRCHHRGCDRFHRPFRPEAEGRLALPHHEFTFDVLALVGTLRHAQHRSIPEIHQHLTDRGVVLAQRTVTHLLDRYDELRALAATDRTRLAKIFATQRGVLLALDGLQPDVGHEVLWVIREVLSGEILLARSLLSSTQADLAKLLREATEGLTVPVWGVVSDGQHAIRKAVAQVFPKVPHQLCHFHYLREAGKHLYEMDRHAKKELKKPIRGVRTLERQVEDDGEPLAQVIHGYCQAIRSALTDDGRPPLDAKGLKLLDRLTAITTSLTRLVEKGGRRNG